MSGVPFIELGNLDGMHGSVKTKQFVNWVEDILSHQPRQRVRFGDGSTTRTGVVCTVFHNDIEFDTGGSYYFSGVDSTYEKHDEIQLKLVEKSWVNEFWQPDGNREIPLSTVQLFKQIRCGYPLPVGLSTIIFKPDVMVESAKLIEDGTGRKKLKVSLPGGRYQLSLNDGAVALFVDDLELETGDTVPNPFVPLVVAMRDAWFPHEKDIDRILEGLPTDGFLTADERAALVGYVTSKRINSRDEERVVDVIDSSPIADDVDTEQLRIKDLPEVPEDIFGTSNNELIDEATATKSRSDTTSTGNEEVSEETTEKPPTPDIEKVEQFQTVPGIGPKRADDLVTAGIRSLDHLAETRPADLAEAPGFTYEMAMVAVEGAREVTGGKQSTAERLSEETGTGPSTFDAALSSLAASGVPPSEASTVLRILYGPTIADIDGVTGQQAYYLWREGFETPADVVQASVDELEEVPQLGSKTAPEIKREATELIEEY